MRKKRNFCNFLMIDDSQKILLDLTAHHEGVERFLEFFKLQRKKPDLIFLQELLLHFSNLPYENLSKIIKLDNDWDSENKIRLPEELIENYISYKLGGTCFSLTFFLQSILNYCGFICYPVMAEMRAGKNIHCCLIVVLGSVKYLVDPGYLLKKPMEINPEKNQLINNKFAGVKLEFDQKNQSYNLFTFNNFETKWRYRFQDKPVTDDEFLRHWLASFKWNSMHRLYLSKTIDEGIFFVCGNFMRKTTFDGKQNFNIKNNFHEAIHDVFGIDKELSEQAMTTLKINLEKERALGLWTPK